MRIPCGRPEALACIQGQAGAPCGTVRFYQTRDGVLVAAEISGLPQKPEDGIFAFHIHTGADCTGADFSDTMGHYNPSGTAHPYHAGDLPPLFSCNGNAYLAVLTNRFRLCEVIGRTVVIHGGVDDFHSQPAGNAGSKIACGVIRRVAGTA